MRALMLLGEPSDADAMRAAAAASKYPYHRLTADAYALALEGNDEELARRIESHDHDSLPWLVVAAQHRATPPLVAALSRCAASDCEQCRTACSEALAELRTT
jgi:hypothetical protein